MGTGTWVSGTPHPPCRTVARLRARLCGWDGGFSGWDVAGRIDH